MNINLTPIIFWGILLGKAVSTHADNTVGPPNILWHNNITGSNKLWTINKTTYTFQSSITLPTNADSPGWRIAGAADFDHDASHQADIYWRHESADINAIWLMNQATNAGNVLLQSTGDTNWHMVGVADFDADTWPDILWEYQSSSLHAIWFMTNGPSPKAISGLSENPSDINWRVACAANLGTNKVPAIIWRHQPTGDVALWYMNGATKVDNKFIVDSAGNHMYRYDPDQQVVGAWDMNDDKQSDIFWRHATVGLNSLWLMNSNTFQGGAYVSHLTPLAPDWFNTDWKAAGQHWIESRQRLNFEYSTSLSAAVTNVPPRITLSVAVPMVPGDSMTIMRRTPPSTTWTNITSGVTVPFYQDNTVVVGQPYEYKVAFSGPSNHETALIKAAITRPCTDLENRGTVVVLIDATLVNQSPTVMNAVFTQIQGDLVADGWTVVRYDAPRHDTSNIASYKTNLANIKTFINSQTAAKGVLIIGHVTIPYSGFLSADNHPDHGGAWPADMYYGDKDGVWTDSSVVSTTSAFPDNWNTIGDGKFDQDYPPSALELFVGRVDFATLTSIPTAEAALLQSYFIKTHKYRYSLPPYPLPAAGVVFDGFNLESLPIRPSTPATVQIKYPTQECIYENAIRNFAAMFANGTTGLRVGDPFYQRSSRSHIWGFLAGPGRANLIGEQWPDPNWPYLQHTSAELQSASSEPEIGFYTLLGSYFGDFNLADNFMRSTLARTNYGLAATWIGDKWTMWKFHSLGLGETLGDAMLATVNNQIKIDDAARWISIHGDATLRLHMMVPPSSLAATLTNGMVTLNWTAGQASTCHVYRSASTNGPFSRITSLPITGTSYSVGDVSSQRAYMVRAIRSETSGSGSYDNLSQGAVAVAK